MCIFERDRNNENVLDSGLLNQTSNALFGKKFVRLSCELLSNRNMAMYLKVRNSLRHTYISDDLCRDCLCRNLMI